MRKRPKLGDVIEIEVDAEFAYAHFTHKHHVFGALLRVFPERFTQRPADFGWVTQAESQFECFFPLGAAVARRVVTVAGTAPIHPTQLVFPTFRSAVRSPTGYGPWHLWDGTREWQVGALEPGMEKMPIRGVVNDTLLVERLKTGWRAEQDA